MITKTSTKEDRIRTLNNRIREGNLLPEWKPGKQKESSIFSKMIKIYKTNDIDGFHFSIFRILKPDKGLVGLHISLNSNSAANCIYRYYGIIERLEWESEYWYKNYLKEQI